MDDESSSLWHEHMVSEGGNPPVTPELNMSAQDFVSTLKRTPDEIWTKILLLNVKKTGVRLRTLSAWTAELAALKNS